MASPIWHTADQSTAMDSTTAGTSANHTINKPTNVAEGDLLLMYIHAEMASAETGSSVTIPSGFTPIRYDKAISVGTTYVPESNLCYKIAGASEPASYTFLHTAQPETNTRVNSIIGRITGHNSISVIDAQSGANTGTNGVSAFTLPAITASADTLLITTLSIYNANSVTSITQPSGMTLEYSHVSTPAGGGLATLGITAAGSTGTKEWAWAGVTRRAAGTIVSLNGAATEPKHIFPVNELLAQKATLSGGNA